jgi:hypothetical protein
MAEGNREPATFCRKWTKLALDAPQNHATSGPNRRRSPQ